MCQRLFAIAVGILACRLVVALIVIPPWQQPDEQAHVSYAEVWQDHFRGVPPRPDPGRQADIIRSMVRRGFWEHYNTEPQALPLPTTFAAVTDFDLRWTIAVQPDLPDYPPTYYRSVGRLLAFGAPRPVERDLQIMRVLSALLALATLWVVWRAARDAAGDMAGGVVALLLALHPQYAVISSAASTDAVIVLAGAVVWWQAVRALRGPRFGFPLAIAWEAAGLATLIDRMGVPLLAASALLTAYITVSRVRLRMKTLVPLGGAAAVGLAGAVWVLGRASQSLRLGALLPVPRARTPEYIAEFTTTLFETWWYVLGWARYHPPPWWTWIALAFSLLSAAGIVRLLRDRTAGEPRPIVLAALAAITVQIGAVYWAYLRVAHMPQGRYLFPMLAPTLLLLWLGIRSLAAPADVGSSRRVVYAAVAAVVLFAVLDAAATLLVAVRVYAY